MMNPDETRDNIRERLFSRINADNGYDEKLGIEYNLDSLRNINLFALDNLQKKYNIVDELIQKYQLEGHDLNNEIAFKELSMNVNLIFKPKGIFSFFK